MSESGDAEVSYEVEYSDDNRPLRILAIYRENGQVKASTAIVGLLPDGTIGVDFIGDVRTQIGDVFGFDLVGALNMVARIGPGIREQPPPREYPTEMTVQENGRTRRMTGYFSVSRQFVLHGVQTETDEKGALREREVYEHGELHGQWTIWRADGSVLMSTTFAHGKEHGHQLGFHNNGRISSICSYVDGLPDGVIMNFFENGRPKSHGQYRSGQQVGKWRQWDESGALIEEIEHGEGHSGT